MFPVIIVLDGGYIAFARMWVIHASNWDAGEFGLGSAPAFALVAVLAAVMLGVAMRVPGFRFARLYYLVGGSASASRRWCSSSRE